MPGGRSRSLKVVVLGPQQALQGDEGPAGGPASAVLRQKLSTLLAAVKEVSSSWLAPQTLRVKELLSLIERKAPKQSGPFTDYSSDVIMPVAHTLERAENSLEHGDQRAV